MLRIHRHEQRSGDAVPGPRGPYAGNGAGGGLVLRMLGALALIALAVPFLLAGFCAIELGGGDVSTVQAETLVVALAVAVPGVWLLFLGARVLRSGR